METESDRKSMLPEKITRAPRHITASYKLIAAVLNIMRHQYVNLHLVAADINSGSIDPKSPFYGFKATVHPNSSYAYTHIEISASGSDGYLREILGRKVYDKQLEYTLSIYGDGIVAYRRFFINDGGGVKFGILWENENN